MQVSQRKTIGHLGHVRGEETGQQVANNATNTVLGEHIEGLIDAKEELDLGAKVASDGANNTKDNSSPWRNETRARGNGNKTSNNTGAKANGTPLPLKTIVEKAPGKATDTSRNVGHNTGHDSTHVGSQGTTTVEAEPANPEEDSSENNVGDVVGAIGKTVDLGVASALAKHE